MLIKLMEKFADYCFVYHSYLAWETTKYMDYTALFTVNKCLAQLLQQLLYHFHNKGGSL